MGRTGYPLEFRQRVLDLVAAGRHIGDFARDLGISDQTVYSWRHQGRIDRGLQAGLTSGERAELVAARRRVRIRYGLRPSLRCHWLTAPRWLCRRGRSLR